MLLLLVSAALAGSLVEEMDAIVLARRPFMAVACSPSDMVLKGITQAVEVPAVRGALGDAPGLEAVLTEGRLKELGVREDGVWSLVAVPQELSLSVPFEGSKDQAAALLTAVAGPDGVRSSREGWDLAGSRLTGEAKLEKDALLVDLSVSALRLSGAAPRPELLSGLPEVSGCLLYVSVANAPDKVPVDGLVLQIPSEGDVVQLRAHGKKPPPASLSRSKGRAPKVATREVPSVVLVLNADLLDVLSELPIDTFSEKDRADLGKLRRRASVGPGVAVGLFDEGKRFVGVAPLKGRLGFKLSKRKIHGAVEALDDELVWSDKEHFTRQINARVLYGEIRRGEVRFATEPTLLAELDRGEGKPWVDETTAAWLEDYPLVLTAQNLDVKKFELKENQVVRFGLGANGEVWTAQISVPEGLFDERKDTMQGPHRGDPGFKLGARPLQPREELEENVNGIFTAELAYDAAFDSFVASTPAPRTLDQLTAEPVEWTTSQGFSDLGWRPEGPVAGTYWVEVSEDGTSFTVHGAIDADGDGVPAHIQRTELGEIEVLTPPDVR